MSGKTKLTEDEYDELLKPLTKELAALARWVQETGRTSGHIGRTAVTYELIPDAAYIAAIDLGGTKVRVAIADLACVIDTVQLPVPVQAPIQPVKCEPVAGMAVSTAEVL